jgi:hypothetical protein
MRDEDWAGALQHTARDLQAQSETLIKQARDLKAKAQRLKKSALKVRKKRWADPAKTTAHKN